MYNHSKEVASLSELVFLSMACFPMKFHTPHPRSFCTFAAGRIVAVLLLLVVIRGVLLLFGAGYFSVLINGTFMLTLGVLYAVRGLKFSFFNSKL